MSWTNGALGASAWSSVTTGVSVATPDRDLFGEIFGLGGGIGDHRGDRLADIGDALMGEDRLGNRDIIGAIEERTDRSDVAESSRGYDWHFLAARSRRRCGRALPGRRSISCDRALGWVTTAGSSTELRSTAAPNSGDEAPWR